MWWKTPHNLNNFEKIKDRVCMCLLFVTIIPEKVFSLEYLNLICTVPGVCRYTLYVAYAVLPWVVTGDKSFKEMTGQRCISLSCWVGTKLRVRQEEIEIGRNGQQTAVLSYAAPQSQTVGCQQGWAVSAASVREGRGGGRTEVHCHNVSAATVVYLKHHA